jgi:hypothetical protein
MTWIQEMFNEKLIGPSRAGVPKTEQMGTVVSIYQSDRIVEEANDLRVDIVQTLMLMVEPNTREKKEILVICVIFVMSHYIMIVLMHIIALITYSYSMIIFKFHQ